jgi:transcriptional regulator with XRE-family HTH domain
LQFNEYLKTCRERYNLTQEELVQELYNTDDEFSGLNTGTLSRWERSATQPSLSKQVGIIKVLQNYNNTVFPCFEELDDKEIENSICKVGIHNLLGNNKKLVLNFLSNVIQVDDMSIIHVRHAENINQILTMPHALDKELTNNFSILEDEHFKTWALHPSNLFLISEYEGQFLGMLFTLRLKPEVFEKIMNFEMKEEDIKVEDFASFEENGCNYILSFFSSNEKSASLLFLRYYAHLIANQKVISDVGALTILDDGRKLINRLNLKHLKEMQVNEGHLSSHRAILSEVLINEPVLKMIFQKQECPEDD